LSKLKDYCQFEHDWPIYEITALDNQLDRLLSVLEIPFVRDEVEKNLRKPGSQKISIRI
jgi:hypothetical protein